MRTVKVRILPPQPNFPNKIAVILASDGLIPLLIPIPSHKKPMFPNDAVSIEGRHRHGPQSKSFAV
jgi:hypothetical protein